MKFSVIKEKILTHLQYANGFTSSKFINPLLQNVYLSVEENVLTMRTTNYQIGFSATIDVDMVESGSLTVSCKKLLDIIKELPETAMVEFNFNDNRLNIKSGKSLFRLATTDIETFPTMAPITGEYYLKLSSKDLISLFKRVSFCVSNEHQKVEYTGAHFNVYGNCLEVYATGLQRVAIANTIFDMNFSDEFIVNIPKKTVTELMKIIENKDIVEISTDKKQMSFKTGNITVYTKLIEKFVKGVSKLFLNDYPIQARLEKKIFMETAKRIATITDEDSPGISLSFETGRLTLSSLETEHGLGKETIEGIEYKGDPFNIIFHARLLQEILNNIESDHFLLEMSSHRSPALITPESDRYRYLIVPISIDKI